MACVRFSAPALAHAVIRAQKQQVRFDVRRGGGRERRLGRGCTDETLGNGGCDPVLYFEDGRKGLVVTIRPFLRTAVRIHQLCSDAYTVAVSLHAALQHRTGAELTADVAEVFVALAEAEARRLRDHAHAVDASERIHDLLGNPIAEVLVIRVSDGFTKGRTATCRRSSGSDGVDRGSSSIAATTTTIAASAAAISSRRRRAVPSLPYCSPVKPIALPAWSLRVQT